jgi:hypothetical protein
MSVRLRDCQGANVEHTVATKVSYAHAALRCLGRCGRKAQCRCRGQNRLACAISMAGIQAIARGVETIPPLVWLPGGGQRANASPTASGALNTEADVLFNRSPAARGRS